MSNTDTILVLGATGKTGRRLLPLLSARGAKVRAASRKPGDGHGRTLFDWHQPDTYDPALAGVDSIYLVPPDLIEDATPIVAPFLDRAAHAGVKRIVLLSSMGVEFPNEGPGSARDSWKRSSKPRRRSGPSCARAVSIRISRKASCSPASCTPT